MNDVFTRKYTMGQSTQKVMNDHAGLWGGIPAIVSKKSALDAILQDIRNKQILQETDFTGTTEDKQQKRLLMEEHAWAVANVLSAFARDTNNETLLNEVDFQMSDFTRAKDMVSVDFAQLVHDNAILQLPAMAGYNLTLGEVNNLQTYINDFETAIPNPRNAESITEAATSHIEDDMKKFNKILKGLDALIAPFKLTDLDFYRTYKNARKIINTGVRKISLRVTVLDDVDEIGIVKGDVTVNEVGIDNTAEKKTGKTGKVSFKLLEAGRWVVTVHRPGYVDAIINNVMILADRITYLTVRLVRL